MLVASEAACKEVAAVIPKSKIWVGRGEFLPSSSHHRDEAATGSDTRVTATEQRGVGAAIPLEGATTAAGITAALVPLMLKLLAQLIFTPTPTRGVSGITGGVHRDERVAGIRGLAGRASPKILGARGETKI